MAAIRIVALLAAACFACHARAESYTCVSYHSPPLAHMQGQRPSGFAVEVVTRVFQRLGHTLEIEFYPWKRALEMAKAGLADCVFTISKSREYDQAFDYAAQSIVPQVVYFYARRGSRASFNGDIESIRQFRIGVASSFSYGPRFEAVRPGLQLDEASSVTSSLIKLAVGRVDLVPSNWYTASYALGSSAMRGYAEKIVMVPVPVESVPTFIAFPKSRKLAALRSAFNAELKAFVASAQYARLLSQYGLDHSPQQPEAGT